VPGVEGRQVVEWARRAEDAGFSTLGTLDRVVYPNVDAFVALSAAAAVTERIRLTTDILLLPPRRNAAIIAKQAAGLHHLSGGRLVLGVAVGLREDDFQATGASMNDRGRTFDRMLGEMEQTWREGKVGPKVDPPPAVLIGGSVDAAFQRAARYGAGWTMGGGTPDALAEGKQKTEAAWKEAGRDGGPRIMALAYYGLGEDGEELAKEDLLHYYEWLGDEIANQIAGSAATDPETVKGYQQAFEQAGCDELIWFPTGTDPEQVDLLAEAALK
jgi:alkanesulfonate monooxygenase SsuD/methylene tetrahydromethanopterin reductase-like flavin-dependent oxidoreductase (luciferase family)